MSTKQKFLQEWWDVNLVNENEKPKVWKRYEAILNDPEVHDQIVEVFDKTDNMETSVEKMRQEKTLYHITTELELDSFLKKWATSDKASWHGQWYGFYVRTNEKLAENHAIDFLEGKWNDLVKLTFMSELTCDKFDLDYEVHAKEIIKFIDKNFDVFTRIKDKDIKIDNNFLYPSLCKKLSRWWILFVCKNDWSQSSFNISLNDEEYSYSMGDANRLWVIFNYMQKEYPEITKKFEEQLFSSSNLRALKYIWKEPLLVKKIEILQEDGSWQERKLN